MNAKTRRKHVSNCFLGGSLASRSGHGDQWSRPQPPYALCQQLQGFQGIFYGNQTLSRTKSRQFFSTDDSPHCSLFKRLGHEVMPIHFFAFDREEEFSWTNRARIN